MNSSSIQEPTEHRAGFVNIIGNPNVGKSTLMNALVGEKLSIVTAKAQTTRHRIRGIVNGENYQIVYSDTPGILKPNYRLQENMMDFVDTAIGDADIILYVTDVVEKAEKNAEYIEKLKKLECPVIIIVNKIDVSDQEKVVRTMQEWQERVPKALIIPVQSGQRPQRHNLQASCITGMVRQGCVHRQEPEILRFRDNKGADSGELLAGDTILLRSGDRVVQGRRGQV